MDSETKVTYSVIAVLIIFLGGLAYFLQPLGVENMKSATDSTSSTTTQASPVKPLTETITKATSTTNTNTSMEDKKYTSAVITTNKGVIEITFNEKTPKTVANFTKLATSRFYDNVRFHRVIKDFMIQVGDPLTKDKTKETQWGTGGPGYTIADELNGSELYALGAVAMANTGQPNSGGSQFFIVTANPSVPLPPTYTVFGKVTKGIETALLIQNVQTTGDRGNPANKPIEDVIIEKIEMK
jgi:cyclophilin family peptidyl-prolyl cis-trans isomerase